MLSLENKQIIGQGLLQAHGEVEDQKIKVHQVSRQVSSWAQPEL